MRGAIAACCTSAFPLHCLGGGQGSDRRALRGNYQSGQRTTGRKPENRVSGGRAESKRPDGGTPSEAKDSTANRARKRSLKKTRIASPAETANADNSAVLSPGFRLKPVLQRRPILPARTGATGQLAARAFWCVPNRLRTSRVDLRGMETPRTRHGRQVSQWHAPPSGQPSETRVSCPWHPCAVQVLHPLYRGVT